MARTSLTQRYLRTNKARAAQFLRDIQAAETPLNMRPFSVNRVNTEKGHIRLGQTVYVQWYNGKLRQFMSTPAEIKSITVVPKRNDVELGLYVGSPTGGYGHNTKKWLSQVDIHPPTMTYR